MKTTAIVLAAVMLVGCATLRPYAEAPDSTTERCRAETKDLTVSTGRKILAYSSNIIVVPVTTALTLGLGTVVMTPMTDDQWRNYNYSQCMARSGYAS